MTHGYLRPQPTASQWLVLLLVTCVGRLRHADSAAVRGRPFQSDQLAETATPSFPRPRTLLWIPVHISEPTTNLEALVDCTFKRHAPSLVGQAFDVLVTLAGNASDGREDDLGRIVEDALGGRISYRPTVRTEFVHLDEDAYDRDQARGRRSSCAGPNTVFYSVMLGGEGGDGQGAPKDDGVPGPPFVPPGPSTSPFGSTYARHIAPYSFVQIMETDCCALQAGWLDALLKPMLEESKLLISGSHPKATCFSPAEHGGTGCEVNLVPGAREHINGNAVYRVGPALQALLRDAAARPQPFDLAMFLVRAGDQAHAHDNPRMYSVGEAVDAALWTESAYYGSDKGVAFVHAPRRLRLEGAVAVAGRVDKVKQVMAVVVTPTADMAVAGRGAGWRSRLAEPTTNQLRSTHAAIHAVQGPRSLLFIALTWPAFEEASRVAPFRVLLANGAQKQDDAWPTLTDLAVRALTAASALARAGLGLVVVGSASTTVVEPGSIPTWTAAPAARERVRLQELASIAGPGTSTHAPPHAVLEVGTLLVGPGDASADALELWAAAVDESAAAAKAASSSRLQQSLCFCAALLLLTLLAKRKWRSKTARSLHGLFARQQCGRQWRAVAEVGG